jgi:hypothetical protein
MPGSVPPRARVRHRPERRRQKLPLQRLRGSKDRAGPKLVGFVARQLDRDCAQERIAQLRIERLRERCQDFLPDRFFLTTSPALRRS